MVMSKKDEVKIRNIRAEEKEDDKFIAAVMSYLSKKYTNDKTRSNKMSLFKKYIEQNNLAPDEQSNKIRDPELRIRLNRLRENKKVPDKEVLLNTVLRRIINLKESDNPDELLIFLLFATGRRITEFINGKWKLVEKKDEDEDGEDEIFIDKISKKRNDDTPHEHGYSIYLPKTIITPKELIKLIAKFHKLNKRKNPEANRMAVNRLLSAHFAPITTARKLRSLYVQFLRDTDNNINAQNSNQAIKDVLHHAEITTSIYYNDKYNIVQKYKRAELIRKWKRDLKEILTKNGFDKSNVVGFNKMNKKQLIDLIIEKEIKK